MGGIKDEMIEVEVMAKLRAVAIAGSSWMPWNFFITRELVRQQLSSMLLGWIASSLCRQGI